MIASCLYYCHEPALEKVDPPVPPVMPAAIDDSPLVVEKKDQQEEDIYVKESAEKNDGKKDTMTKEEL